VAQYWYRAFEQTICDKQRSIQVVKHPLSKQKFSVLAVPTGEMKVSQKVPKTPFLEKPLEKLVSRRRIYQS
jgi:hypothetical protein